MAENYNYLLDPVVGDPLQFQLAKNKVKPRHWRNKATAEVCNLTDKPLWVKYLGQNGKELPVIDPENVADIATYPLCTPIAYWKEADYHNAANADIKDNKTVAFIDDRSEVERYSAAITTAELLEKVCNLTVKSTTETSSVGTRKLIPVILPFNCGKTSPTAFAAPVDEGIIL